MKNKGKDKITKLFSSPLSNVISLVIAIISIILAIYFYKTGKEKRELMFYCNPIKTTLIKGGQISPLEIYVNNEKISQDITAIQIAIWNNGKRPIEDSDILKEIVIYSEPKVPFIDAKIYKISRDVICFRLNKDHLAEGYIPISWKILEKNDGGAIQIIYKGSTNVNILLRGIIKGQKEISTQTFKGKILTQEEQIQKMIKERKIIAIFFLFAALTFPIMIYSTHRIIEQTDFLLVRIFRITILLSSFICFMAFFILFFIKKFKAPPFGF